MRRLIAFTFAAAFCPLGFVGCSDTTSTETKKEISTPGGTTEVKTETTVEKSGDNPPPATNP